MYSASGCMMASTWKCETYEDNVLIFRKVNVWNIPIQKSQKMILTLQSQPSETPWNLVSTAGFRPGGDACLRDLMLSCVWTTECYGLNVYVSSKFLYWNPDSQCDDINRRGLWEIIGAWRWSPHEHTQLTPFFLIPSLLSTPSMVSLPR